MEAMDLMDPRHRRSHNIRLMIGYVLVAVAVVLIAVILLFVGYGFDLQNGRVVQNGLFFLSSTPNPAQIYINGQRYGSDTNARILLPEGTYSIKLERVGYRNWQREITVVGGQVASYTYPLLVPNDLVTTAPRSYTGSPGLVTESGDRHWLLVGHPDSLATFDLYDLSSPGTAPTALTLPVSLLTPSSAKQNLQTVAWANDNNHLLLKHTYGANTEYILLNRSSPAQSQNLTQLFGLPPTGLDLQFDGQQNDHFIALDSNSQVLSLVNLGAPTLQPLLTHVLMYAANGSDNIAYITPDAADAKLVDTILYDGNDKYPIRHDPAGDSYLLAIDNFNGNTYLAAGDTQRNAAYVYADPIDEIKDPHLGVAVPDQAFAIKAPNFVDFSANGQYVVFEDAQQFAVYDASRQQGLVYSVPLGLDAPQTHASWLDNARLYYTSHGKVVMLDYDGQNQQTLMPANTQYPLVIDGNNKFLYAFAPSATDNTQELLTSTVLRTPADQ